jgi:hypothetical protein
VAPDKERFNPDFTGCNLRNWYPIYFLNATLRREIITGYASRWRSSCVFFVANMTKSNCSVEEHISSSVHGFCQVFVDVLDFWDDGKFYYLGGFRRVKLSEGAGGHIPTYYCYWGISWSCYGFTDVSLLSPLEHNPNFETQARVAPNVANSVDIQLLPSRSHSSLYFSWILCCNRGFRYAWRCHSNDQ